MAYDVLLESVALIEAGSAEPIRSLSRRRRHAAMAVDVSGDVAVSMFARRGVGCTHQEIHVLALRNGAWTWLGGGGGSSGEGLLADRPAVLPGTSLLGPDAPVSSDSRVITSSGAGGVLDTYGEFEPSDGGRWISYAILQVSAEVAFVETTDRRLRVPWHGRVLLVWCGDQPLPVVARSATGERLADLSAA